jgi:hypothetical protein
MSLSFTGEFLQTMNTNDYKAFGSPGEQIIVKASHEAIQDYGEVAVQAKAVEKYNDNQVINHTVTVETSDFHA